MALGTAIQFETMMRQKDVIGEWEPLGETDKSLGIVLNGGRWVNGLTWADIPPSMVIIKDTTKTGATVVADLKLCPLVMKVLSLVSPDKRVGPLIIDEKSGRPYAEDGYAREWRIVAQAAGIPDHVKNMDARAGAISEADEALAPLDEIRSTAGHSQASTTFVIFAARRASRNTLQNFVNCIVPVNKTRTRTEERDGERGNARSIVERQSDELACKFGAGEGNRTLVCSLGSCRSTIELRPRSDPMISRPRAIRQAPTRPSRTRP